MRPALAMFLAIPFAFPLPAQQAAPSSQTIQMECRDFGASGSYLAPNETLIDGRACHQVVAQPSQSAAKPGTQPPTSPQTEAYRPAPEPATGAPAAPSASTSEKVRVFVTDSQSWEMRGGWNAGGHTNSDGSGSWGGGGYEAGGARPQTVEIVKTFNQRCPELTVTNNLSKANFVVTLDHEGGKGYLHHRNKIAVFNRDGDDIFSDSTRELGNSVKDACQAILSSAAKR